MRPAIQRVNVDFTVDMLKELDRLAKELNVSRQAVIKTYLRRRSGIKPSLRWRKDVSPKQPYL